MEDEVIKLIKSYNKKKESIKNDYMEIYNYFVNYLDSVEYMTRTWDSYNSICNEINNINDKELRNSILQLWLDKRMNYLINCNK